MTITKRNTKGSALTYNEMDENIRDLFEDTTLDRVAGNGATTTTPVNLSRINFPAHTTDYAYIKTDVNGTSTSFDFHLGDDDGDAFRWRVAHWDDGVAGSVDYMKLKVDTDITARDKAVLTVDGRVTADYMAASHTSVVETGSGASPFTSTQTLYGKRVIWNRTTDQEYMMPNPTAVDIGKSIIILNASTSTTAVLKFDFGSVTTTRFADVNGLTALTGDKEVSILAGGVVEVLVIGAGDIVLFGSNLTAL